MGKTLGDVNYTIPDIQDNPEIEDVVLKAGQTVRIVRVVTYAYEVDISDILDANDNSEISVFNLVEAETDNPYELEASDVEGDVVVSVEIL